LNATSYFIEPPYSDQQSYTDLPNNTAGAGHFEHEMK